MEFRVASEMSCDNCVESHALLLLQIASKGHLSHKVQSEIHRFEQPSQGTPFKNRRSECS